MRRPLLLRRLVPWSALLPMALVVVVAYLGCALWSLRISLSSSRTFPADDWVGFEQYARLFDNDRWLLSLQNLAIYGVLFIAGCMAIGFLLAVFIDAKVRGEGLLRTVQAEGDIDEVTARLNAAIAGTAA